MKIIRTLNDPIRSIIIRQVWAENLEFELTLISMLIDTFSFVSMDTEFPGVIFRKKYGVSNSNRYDLLKKNVDALKIIQVGLTLTDSRGNLPNLGSDKHDFIWQFNFRDFDLSRDLHAPDSVELLKRNGVDFVRNVEFGIDSVKFGELIMSSGLLCNDDVTWVTFHCAYDFGYLVRVLTQRLLPDELGGFLDLVRVFFGESVYDVKYMIKFCDGLYGGLDRVAKALREDREVGCSHQAGSDSLLTWRVFHRIRDVFGGVDRCDGILYGLEFAQK